MADPISTTVSVLALAISILTAWLTLFRRGTLKMTQPTAIYFGPDKARPSGQPGPPKVYLRTLLFSTAKRGRVIESMHVSLSRDETRQNFNIWVYGDDKLVRGSGLFVGETGVATNHHFLTPRFEDLFTFANGKYKLEVFAQLVGDRDQIRLFSQVLEISNEESIALKTKGAGLYFDWGPDSSRYLSHVEHRSPLPDPQEFLDTLDFFSKPLDVRKFDR